MPFFVFGRGRGGIILEFGLDRQKALGKQATDENDDTKMNVELCSSARSSGVDHGNKAGMFP